MRLLVRPAPPPHTSENEKFRTEPLACGQTCIFQEGKRSQLAEFKTLILRNCSEKVTFMKLNKVKMLE